jgi:hypothetical protein
VNSKAATAAFRAVPTQESVNTASSANPAIATATAIGGNAMEAINAKDPSNTRPGTLRILSNFDSDDVTAPISFGEPLKRTEKFTKYSPIEKPKHVPLTRLGSLPYRARRIPIEPRH